jgi:predicted phage baseplate assembly protein
MSIPEVALDDVRFQDLVDQCRRQIAAHCPEWTAVNVSDPGVTLIELFAWMTDMLSYRINRLPEKLHVALLSLLDVHLQPPEAATCDVRFQLERPPASSVVIPARTTEVATERTPTQEAVVFQTSADFTIHPAQPEACMLERGARLTEVTISRGYALPAGEERFAFGLPPQPGDCLYLGFRRPLDRLLLRVEVDCRPAHGVGVEPRHPPLAWEVSAPGEQWSAAEILGDSTEGFNKGRGAIELALPAHTGAHTIGLQRLYWLCCRVVGTRDEPYTRPPEIFSLTAGPIGASIPAEHCRRIERESLGYSDGSPGECFRLRHAPILSPAEDERLEVRDPNTQQWSRWQQVETFADSSAEDRHYLLDATAGEVELGPAVLEANGKFRRYGAVPAPRSELRFSAYRHGGGTAGNVAAKTLVRLRRPIARVRSVTNPLPASGGVDGESLALARVRTAIALRTRDRAVTREDFEHLATAASGRIARAHCLSGGPSGLATVYVVPRVTKPARRLSLLELTPSDELLATVARFLDERRLLGTTVAVAPARYRGIKVVVRAVSDPATDPAELEYRVLRALYTYLNPLIGGSARGEGEGWSFRRTLRHGELFSIVGAIEGVKEISMLLIYEEDLASGESLYEPLDDDLELAANELVASGTHRVRIEAKPYVEADTAAAA